MNIQKLCDAMEIGGGSDKDGWWFEKSPRWAQNEFDKDDGWTADSALTYYLCGDGNECPERWYVIENVLARVLKEKGYAGWMLTERFIYKDFAVLAWKEGEKEDAICIADSKPLAMLGALDKLLEDE